MRERSHLVIKKAGRRGPNLPLIMATQTRGTIGNVNGRRHIGEGNLTYTHTGVENDGDVRHIGKLEGEEAIPAGVNISGSGMNHQAETTKRRLALEATDDVVGKGYALKSRAKRELPWMKYEGAIRVDNQMFGIVNTLGHRVNERMRGVLENSKVIA